MKTVNMPRGIAFAVAAFAMASTGACVDRHMDGPPSALAPSPSAVVIGVAPAPPQGETEQTTPVDPTAKSDVTPQKEASYPMPWPGQPNDHSNLAPNPSQKADWVDPRLPEPAKSAESAPKTERTDR